MRNRIQRFWRDERGISTMLVGFGFVGFMGAATLALDIGMNVLARTQAQNSADAGALSGATALVFDDYNDRSAGGPAVQSAINAARENDVIGGDVNVDPPDVTFPLGPTGLNNRVRVFVDRDVPTVLASFFGTMSMNIKAAATAEASPANAATCLLPFIIPDKWEEIVAPPWNPNSEFDYADKKQQVMNPHDEYRPGPRPPGGTGTGYDVNIDTGTILILKQDNNGKVAPSVYNPYRIPGSSGAADYEAAISGCNTTIVNTDIIVDQEPGMMTGPTRDGIINLVNQDAGAYWEPLPGCNCIRGSDPKFGGMSPRLRTIPLYDPILFDMNRQPGLANATFKIVSFLGVFIVGMQGNDVIARIHPVTGLVNGSNTTLSSFAMAIRLVE
jgi:putative Flp pilus-assembly TadE/G-like protein